MAKTLAKHDDVDATWYAGSDAGQAAVQSSSGNMNKKWMLDVGGALPYIKDTLREATQVKNIWVPYGA